MSDIREAFEAWFSKWGMTPKAVIESLREGEEYPQDSMREVNAAWHAWQAALSANGGEAYVEIDIRRNPMDGTPEPRILRFTDLGDGTHKLYTHPAPPSVAMPFLRHLLSVIGGVLAGCEPNHVNEEAGYIGGQALEELETCEKTLRDMLAAALLNKEPTND